jgi:Trp operon repressor
MRFYHLVVEAHGRFPSEWEREVLLVVLEREPGRTDLVERLEVVERLISGSKPSR